ncbi:MAG TPA: ABC transporter ATP-binding protein [Candidatus Agrococcus pullicola]|uniref:ABC transporter ATP-binding protein n=1 Tax=Candidatus Agrococcus pullicola TaxID=2838429 RepID=A0A9D1YUM5_9MICO|nr:ABC transporter ATP-binding protein [Candidatus Agrococcus pullicola]
MTTPPTHEPRLIAEHVDLAYTKGRLVAEDLSINVAQGKITALLGPNACGKSTLLRALARLLAPVSGAVYLDGASIASMPTKRVAASLGLLPQSPSAPEGITVEDLVGRGRFPHQRLFQQWSSDDAAAVDEALELTGTAELRHRPVDELSGGQRQRAWIAMALAQQTDLLLLDEPTTYLDLAHRMEILDLLADLNEQRGRTIVMVLHELNEACRYAHRVVTMNNGAIVAEGAPHDIVTAELVERVFGLECRVVPDPVTGTPLVLPRARRTSRPSSSGE